MPVCMEEKIKLLFYYKMNLKKQQQKTRWLEFHFLGFKFNISDVISCFDTSIAFLHHTFYGYKHKHLWPHTALLPL